MSRAAFSPRAAHDLDEIAEYLVACSPAVAVRFAEVVRDLAQMLGRYPDLGAETRGERQARSCLVPGFPYRLHYTTRGGELLVLHVRHTSRREWKGDDE